MTLWKNGLLLNLQENKIQNLFRMQDRRRVSSSSSNRVDLNPKKFRSETKTNFPYLFSSHWFQIEFTF